MRALKKTIQILEGILNRAEILFCLVIMVLSIYCLYDAKLVYDNANDTSLLRYKPGYSSNENEPEKQILKEKLVAWITLDDTNVDYPVMQSSDNDEFLNMDPYGEYSLSGSIFLDYRNSRDFSDPYCLIYGHHMDQGYLFGALDKYLDKSYFKSHQKGTLTAGSKKYAYTLYAILEAMATEDAIFAPQTMPFSKTLAFIKENALFYDEKKAPASDACHILALSTCKKPDTTERTIVVGILKEE